jgi:hypothetical protein
MLLQKGKELIQSFVLEFNLILKKKKKKKSNQPGVIMNWFAGSY